MFVIGIAGGTGSGKTTVVNKIVEALPESKVAVIPQDSYYKDNSHIPVEKREELNFDHPSSFEINLLIDHIIDLKRGKSILQPVYSYLTHTRTAETITVYPRKIIIIEGILIFNYEPLRKLIDLKVYVDADADDRLSRVINRDINERGRSINRILERYYLTVKPMHLQFIEPTKRYADIIVPQGGENEVAISVLKSMIERKLDLT